MIKQIHLEIRSKAGHLYRHSATIEVKDGRIWFLKSPFAAKDEIKAMRGSKWHGNDKPPVKVWSVEDCPRNRFQLAYLMGEDVYAWFERGVEPREYTAQRNGKSVELMPHQKELADHGLTYHYGVWAAEMGCVSGDAIVLVNRGGRRLTMPLRELYLKFNHLNTGRKWSNNTRTHVRALRSDHFDFVNVLGVANRGRRPTVKVSLVSGRSIRVTPDHLICVGRGYTAASQLNHGDTVFSYGRYEFGRPTCRHNGGALWVPESDIVLSVEDAGEIDVYDIACQSPHNNFVADGVVVHNCGKTLAAQKLIEKSGVTQWWWVGPKTSLPNMRREFRQWGFDFDGRISIEFMTYEALVRRMDEWKSGDFIPQGVIFDESSRLKGAGSQRSQAAQLLADLIRTKYKFDGFVILMSGTPSPKTPLDWFSQCEIAWPGFLREGSPKALEQRLAFLVDHEYDSGIFKKRKGWKDCEDKCAVCGDLRDIGPHEVDEEGYHRFAPSFNEVAYMHERLQGLVVVKHKKDCLNLPDKRYRRVVCKPSSSIVRVAKALADSAPNTITGLMWLRELSDGFQYKDVRDGDTKCTHCPDACGKVFEWFRDDKVYQNIEALEGDFERREIDCPKCGGTGLMAKIVRTVKEVPCPKDKALRADLERCEETGRIVIFAGFTGSVDRVTNICRKAGWTVVRCDGRGFVTLDLDGNIIQNNGDDSLEYWGDMDNPRVAFVAHPESGGMSLTLTQARMAVFYSNSYKPEYRSQSEDRLHRPGMDLNAGCEIVDYLHLPSDRKVLDTILANRKLELMTLGEINWEEDTTDSDPNVVVEEIA